MSYVIVTIALIISHCEKLFALPLEHSMEEGVTSILNNEYSSGEVLQWLTNSKFDTTSLAVQVNPTVSD